MSDYDITSAHVAAFDPEIDAQLMALADSITKECFPPVQDYRGLHPGEPDASGRHSLEAVHRYLHLARPRYNLLVQWLRPMAGMRGADIGPAYGFLDVLLAEQYGLQIIATEHPANMAAYSGLLLARGVEVRPWLLGRDPCPLEQERFDFVIFAEVLEHLKLPPLRTLREVVTPLKPGGTLVLSTPNIGRTANIKRLRRGKNILEPYREDAPPDRDVTDFVAHIREYSVQEVVDLVEAVGLRIQTLAMCNWMDEAPDPRPLRNHYTCILATKP